jgi:hypothetical protein
VFAPLRFRGFGRSFFGVAVALACSASRHHLLAQTATIGGRVVVKGSEVAVGYAVVAARPAARELFANAEGRFLLREVKPGRVTLTVRHIGYAPLDTAFTVAAGDSLHVTLELALVTIRLPAVHSLATACLHPGFLDPKVGLELATLFAQVKENADRNRLLSRSYPFELDVERKITKPEPALEARFVAYDTIVKSSEREWRYAPGKMLGTREYPDGVFAGKWSTLTMPELADFADERFLNNHCFDFAGTDVVDGDTLLRIDFMPAPVVREPDVAGSIYLDPKTFQLRMTLLSLVNLNRHLRGLLAGQSIRADFKEAIPGVSVLDRVSSVVFPKDDDKAPAREPATETHRILAIRFLRGRP